MENSELSGLIRRVAAGDADSLEKIFLGMKDSILAFSMTFVGSRHTAEDVLQETMLKVWKGAGGYRPTGSARTWVLTIARNTAVDFIRRASREIPSEDGDGSFSDEKEPDTAPGELAEMVERLPAVERRIVLLHAVSGLKHREIAELLHLPLGTECRKYSESIRRLRRACEDR